MLMVGLYELELEEFSADKRWLVLSTRDVNGLPCIYISPQPAEYRET